MVPRLPSGASVWFFFQTSLLLGYAYAHVLTQRIKLSQQPWIHLALIACSFVWLPITPTVGKIQALPQIEIITLLLKHLSFPFILLTATAPLLQSWYAQLYPKRSPYRLYALSNLGSLIALLSYPFFN